MDNQGACNVACSSPEASLGGGLYRCCKDCPVGVACKLAYCALDRGSCGHVVAAPTELEECIRQAVEKWGVDSQLEIALEEALELALALQHLKRGKTSTRDVMSETADMKIMVAQLEYIFRITGYSDEYDKISAAKLAKFKNYLA